MVNCVERFSLFFALIMCYCVSGFPLSATVDQRQTGTFNIQFNIKDMAIIFQKDSVWGTNVGDDISYDYDYDYDHLTIKPDSWGIFNGTKPSKPPIYITTPPKPQNSPNKPLGTVTILGEDEPQSESEATSSTEKTTTVKYAWNGELEQIPVAVIMDTGHKVKGRKSSTTKNPGKRLERPLNVGLWKLFRRFMPRHSDQDRE